MSKTLVLYVFHIYNDRVEHFINNCILYLNIQLLFHTCHIFC